MRRLRVVVGWITVLVVIAAPVVAAAWIVDRARSSVVTSTPQVWIPATAVGATRTEPAVIVPTWERRAAVVAPAWSGLVQQVLIRPGDQLSSGSQVVVINGIVRIAARTDVPISRPLTRGARGPDVAALNSLLASMRLPVSPDDTFGSSTAAGVSALAEGLGAGDTEQFDPGWVLFLPFGEPLPVASVGLAVAQPAPAPGAEVLTVQPQLVSARLVPPDALIEQPEQGQAGPAAPAGEVPAPVDLDEVLLYTDLPAGAAVAVADSVLGPVDPDGSFPAPTLTALAATVEPGADVVGADLQTSLPADAVNVPTSAVVTGPGGATCVILRDEAEFGRRPIPVVIVETVIGVSTVTGVEPDREVLVGPPRADRQLCRSS